MSAVDSVQLVNFGMFRLDGGSMFGSVPKNLWSKKIPADAENCITLATRSMLIRTAGRLVLVDVGMGDKWPEKLQAIYGIKNTPQSDWGFKPEEVTDIILTHLHFDHAGGISRYTDSKELVPAFPNARVFLQKANWENAHNPTIKEKASYLPENYGILEKMNLQLVDGETEVLPGITVHRVDGHTRGQQWLEVKTSNDIIFYPTDLIPTSHHVPLPYHMGYDICADTLLREKNAFLNSAVQKNALVVFEHDPQIVSGRIKKEAEGKFEFLQVDI